MCSMASIYIMKPRKKGSVTSLNTHSYVQPAEILELGVNSENRESFLVGIIKPGTIKI